MKTQTMIVPSKSATHENVGQGGREHIGQVECPYCQKVNMLGHHRDFAMAGQSTKKVTVARKCKHATRCEWKPMQSTIGDYVITFETAE